MQDYAINCVCFVKKYDGDALPIAFLLPVWWMKYYIKTIKIYQIDCQGLLDQTSSSMQLCYNWLGNFQLHPSADHDCITLRL